MKECIYCTKQGGLIKILFPTVLKYVLYDITKHKIAEVSCVCTVRNSEHPFVYPIFSIFSVFLALWFVLCGSGGRAVQEISVTFILFSQKFLGKSGDVILP